MSSHLTQNWFKALSDPACAVAVYSGHGFSEECEELIADYACCLACNDLDRAVATYDDDKFHYDCGTKVNKIYETRTYSAQRFQPYNTQACCDATSPDCNLPPEEQFLNCQAYLEGITWGTSPSSSDSESTASNSHSTTSENSESSAALVIVCGFTLLLACLLAGMLL